MKYFLFFALFILLNISCSNSNFDELKALNNLTLSQRNLVSFESLKKSQTRINGLSVCDETIKKCRPEEVNFVNVLQRENLSVDTFLIIQQEMQRQELTRFYRIGSASLWVNGGALGEITGYVVSDTDETPKSFRLNEQYYIYVGKKVSKDVFWFTGY